MIVEFGSEVLLCSALAVVNEYPNQYAGLLAWEGSLVSGDPIVQDRVNSYNTGVIYNHIFGPTLTNETRVTYSRGDAFRGPNDALAQGIVCVFQELSLCPNLSAMENTLMVHPGLGGLGWEKRTRALIAGGAALVVHGRQHLG